MPASFDAVARELTVEAARAAGLENLTLLEEPQAAFYAWIDASKDRWREQVEVGDVVLVCDVGGGTTDFSLIAVSEEAGQLVLTRVAVGDHILLGGDNMDLALAHHGGRGFRGQGHQARPGPDAHALAQLPARQGNALRRSRSWPQPRSRCSAAAAASSAARIKGELTRAEVEKVLVDGFFPHCPADAVPQRQRGVGLQELGLPYAADPAVSKHLA